MGNVSGDEQRISMIVGLGNPGDEYAETRHNVGFLFVEQFLKKMPGTWNRVHAYSSYYWKGTYAGRKLLIQLPQTYMNLSGDAVGPLAAAEEIRPEQIMVVHDDMDLHPGKIRIRSGGSSGGHNGILSIINRLGTESFNRMRIGIGKMPNGHGSADYVLSKFEETERALMESVLKMSVEAMILAIRRGLPMAMNEYNRRDLSEPVIEEPETKQAEKITTTTHQEV